MSAHKHTPGPWVIMPRNVEHDGSVYPRHIVGGTQFHQVCPLESSVISTLATQNPGTYWDTSPTNEANARLIAAAPELLAALQIAVRQNSHEMLMTGDELRVCEAAIAKATGGAA